MGKQFGAAIMTGLFVLCVCWGCDSSKNDDSTAPPSADQPAATEPAGLVPFTVDTSEGDRYGYQDASGAVAVKPRFLVANEFSDSGLAAVVDESGWAYIDTRGEVVVRPFVFDNGPDPFSEGLARFERDGRFGYFNEQGKQVIEPRFDFGRPFSEGLAAVCTGCVREQAGEHWTVSGGKWGYIDKSGDEVIPFAFDEADSFEGGRASVVAAGRPKSIGHDGRPLR